MPHVRAMTFGYNASVVGNTSVAGIRDNARSLLVALRNLRTNDGSEGRSIVFLGHSMGGIIIKKALRAATNEYRIHGDVASSTRGIVFFGTPHRGTGAAIWGEMVAGMIGGAFSGRDTADYCGLLRPKEKDLMDLSEDFRPLIPRFAIQSFYEENPFPKMSRVIVERKSGVLEVPQEEYCLMPGDHSSIVKFSPNKVDEGRFNLAWRAIERASRGPDTSTTAEFHAVYREFPEPSHRQSGYRPRSSLVPVEVTGRIEAPEEFDTAPLNFPWRDGETEDARARATTEMRNV